MRILVADGQSLTTDALVEYLKQHLAGAEVEGATSIDRAFERLDTGGEPDLILLDRDLLGKNGTATLAALREKSPGVRVVVMDAEPTQELVKIALAQGAAGVIPRSISGEAMIKVLELVLAGESYAPPMLGLGGRAGSGAGRRAGAADADTALQFGSLTPREREVLALILRGYSNKKIAYELRVKEITVAFHLRGLFRKLAVSNRTQAATKALQSGWMCVEASAPDGA